MKIEMPCIVCPMSCHLTVEIEEATSTVISVSGNTCPRGVNYAKNEIRNPQRMLTTTVRIDHAMYPLLPVISSKDVPKTRLFDIIEVCKNVCIQAPISYGDVVISNVLDLGVDIIASRSMDKVEVK